MTHVVLVRVIYLTECGSLFYYLFYFLNKLPHSGKEMTHVLLVLSLNSLTLSKRIAQSV
jgi:hypothetical protein